MSTDQFHAQLFLRLAEFVVWAEQHDGFAVCDPDFVRLRERCAAALVPRDPSQEKVKIVPDERCDMQAPRRRPRGGFARTRRVVPGRT